MLVAAVAAVPADQQMLEIMAAPVAAEEVDLEALLRL